MSHEFYTGFGIGLAISLSVFVIAFCLVRLCARRAR